MNSMFENSKFNNDISNWDVSNVTNITNIFNKSEFNKNITNIFNKSEFNKNILKWNLINNDDNIGLKGYNRKKHLEYLKKNYPEYFFNECYFKVIFV